mgnify:CR=1 FL=1
MPYCIIHRVLHHKLHNFVILNIVVREEAARALVSAKFFWPQDGDKCTVTCGASKMASDLVMPIIGDGGKDGNFEVENSTQ